MAVGGLEILTVCRPQARKIRLGNNMCCMDEVFCHGSILARISVSAAKLRDPKST